MSPRAGHFWDLPECGLNRGRTGSGKTHTVEIDELSHRAEDTAARGAFIRDCLGRKVKQRNIEPIPSVHRTCRPNDSSFLQVLKVNTNVPIGFLIVYTSLGEREGLVLV